MIKGIIGGLIAGFLGAAVWAAIAYYTGYEVGYVAWGIGLLVGVVVSKASGEEGGGHMGVAAAVIAVLAILAGKYGTVHALTQQLLAKNPMREVTDEFLQLSLASSIVDEWTESGHAMTWPQGKSIDTAEKQEDFPPEVWKETMKRWDDTPGEKREEVRSLMKQDMEAARANIASSVKWDAFKSSFDFMDVIFIGLALLSSFRIGSIRSKAAPMAP